MRHVDGFRLRPGCRLRSSTRRRTLFSNDGSPATPLTPDARTRRLLGRTPTKLYSPFGIESPPHRGRAGAPKQDVSSLSRSGVEASTRKKVPRCRHRAAPGDVREACGNGRCVMCTAHYIHMSLRI
ncbi:uncharacterized protein LOC134535090 isoform X3 [Bacillus rossius redtenbacheri]|uniref:uncharacterized protein LOC134535090 isoform X3 n=1 Tax=Bacillus rossius redtenbacheri TaxID=93214 RepID=UPI002FDE2110